MEIKHYMDSCEDTYYIKEKLSNSQTLEFGFEKFDSADDTDYWNIYISIYSKRKHKSINEDKKLLTGKGNTFETYKIIREAFPQIEERILEETIKSRIIFTCYWIDNRRRDVYKKFLERYNYAIGFFGDRKVLIKVCEKV